MFQRSALLCYFLLVLTTVVSSGESDGIGEVSPNLSNLQEATTKPNKTQSDPSVLNAPFGGFGGFHATGFKHNIPGVLLRKLSIKFKNLSDKMAVMSQLVSRPNPGIPQLHEENILQGICQQMGNNFYN